jgi:hypothetical protein
MQPTTNTAGEEDLILNSRDLIAEHRRLSAEILAQPPPSQFTLMTTIPPKACAHLVFPSQYPKLIPIDRL